MLFLSFTHNIKHQTTNPSAMAQQQQQLIPFVFQGNTFYKTQVDMKNNKGSMGQVLSVYDAPMDGAFIGTIINARYIEENILFEKFTITSYAGHTYIYDLNTELLLWFIYAVGMQTIPTKQEIAQLEAFALATNNASSDNDWMGAFHILDLHEYLPEAHLPILLK